MITYKVKKVKFNVDFNLENWCYLYIYVYIYCPHEFCFKLANETYRKSMKICFKKLISLHAFDWDFNFLYSQNIYI